MVTIFSLPPGWGERIRDKVASVPEAERGRVFQEAVIAEFTVENDRITAALAVATEPSKVEELRLARARLGAEMMLVGEGLLEATNVITADPATVSTRLAALEARWRETGNAAFVWRALELLLNVIDLALIVLIMRRSGTAGAGRWRGSASASWRGCACG